MRGNRLSSDSLAPRGLTRTLQILRGMTPDQKLARVFKLNERVLNQMRAKLRHQYPDIGEAELHQRYLERRIREHNWDS